MKCSSHPLLALAGLICCAPAFSAEPVLTDLGKLAAAIESKDFPAAQSMLAADVVVLTAQGPAGLLGTEGDARTRLLLHSALKRLPVSALADPEWLESRREFITWLFRSPHHLETLIGELRPEDDVTRVLEVWAELWKREKNEKFREDYAGLALGLALIYDQPDHVRTKQGAEYEGSMDAEGKYDFFRDASEAGKLKTNAKQLVPRQWIHVVDIVVSKREAEWTHDKVNGSRKNWGEHYDSIEYLMERAVEGLNPYESYILSEILKEGGICHDQAYYSSETAKAYGIPASYISGVGDRGGHAWLGFMPEDHEWAVHGDQGITNGNLYDDQRGRDISYDLLVLEADADFAKDRRVPALMLMDAAASAKDPEMAIACFKAARAASKLSPEPWQAEFRFLLATRKDDDKALAAHLAEVERRFRDFPVIVGMVSDLRREHLMSRLSEEDLAKELDQEIRRNHRKYEDKGDIVANSVASLAKMLVERRSPEGLRKLFKASFRRCGEDLELFSKLMDRYLESTRSFPEIHKDVAGDLEDFYDRYADSNSDEYFRGMMEVGLHKRVAQAYDDAGEKDKATSLRKKIARREKGLKKDAI
ncbi:MAG: hypothetical protein MUF31_11390 [Akkermansiaceae bacterium]|nr:hypothetical protein [Akkermansiaceae bacterium]